MSKKCKECQTKQDAIGELQRVKESLQVRNANLTYDNMIRTTELDHVSKQLREVSNQWYDVTRTLKPFIDELRKVGLSI